MLNWNFEIGRTMHPLWNILGEFFWRGKFQLLNISRCSISFARALFSPLDFYDCNQKMKKKKNPIFNYLDACKHLKTFWVVLEINGMNEKKKKTHTWNQWREATRYLLSKSGSKLQYSEGIAINCDYNSSELKQMEKLLNNFRVKNHKIYHQRQTKQFTDRVETTWVRIKRQYATETVGCLPF